MICIKCNEDKLESEFDSRAPSEKYREGKVRTECRVCRAKRVRENYLRYKQESYFKYRVQRAKRAASTYKVPFDLDAEYLESIWIPICPILGVQLEKLAERTDDNAAELDRFIPSLGYVKGNVAFLSRRANRLKNDATLEELTKITDWMKSVSR